MNSWFRKTITSLYNAVTAPVAATRDALADRLQNVRETASSLYNRARARLGYVQQETLKDVVEEQAEQEHPEEQEAEQEARSGARRHRSHTSRARECYEQGLQKLQIAWIA